MQTNAKKEYCIMNKVLTVGVATLAIAGVVSVSSLSASALNGNANGIGVQMGTNQRAGQGKGAQSSLEARAKVFGMTVAELAKSLENKTMSQIAVERGMNEETFQAKMTEAAKARWEVRGLSTEEIAKRIADRDARHAANSADHEFGSGDGNHQGGYGQNR